MRFYAVLTLLALRLILFPTGFFLRFYFAFVRVHYCVCDKDHARTSFFFPSTRFSVFLWRVFTRARARLLIVVAASRGGRTLTPLWPPVLYRPKMLFFFHSSSTLFKTKMEIRKGKKLVPRAF